MGGRLVTFDLGPCVHDELPSTAIGQRSCTIERAIRRVEAQAHFRRYWNRARHCTSHLAENGVQQLRLLEQHSTAAGLVHRFRRAAEVEVDHRRAQFTGISGIFRQADRIGPEQLQTHRRAAASLRSTRQLRRQLAVMRSR